MAVLNTHVASQRQQTQGKDPTSRTIFGFAPLQIDSFYPVAHALEAVSQASGIETNDDHFRNLNETMTAQSTPKVSIGLPVYNGETFLRETLDSILAQTFEDFELVISDNASTDSTPAICEEYAARDSRIRYVQQPENLGASRNYNIAFELSRGEYFKWAASDDLIAPEFLERAVGILDRNPNVVLCYSLAQSINGDGEVIREHAATHYASHPSAQKRFSEFVRIPHPFVPVFGLMRREVLAKTRLIGPYAGSDRPLISELSLLGQFYEIPEYLFFYRNHKNQSWQHKKTRHEQQAWYAPERKGKISFPHWRVMGEHIRSIQRAPLSLPARLECYAYMGYWARLNWKPLTKNLVLMDHS